MFERIKIIQWMKIKHKTYQRSAYYSIFIFIIKYFCLKFKILIMLQGYIFKYLLNNLVIFVSIQKPKKYHIWITDMQILNNTWYVQSSHKSFPQQCTRNVVLLTHEVQIILYLQNRTYTFINSSEYH